MLLITRSHFSFITLVLSSFCLLRTAVAQPTVTFVETKLSGPPTANHIEDLFFLDENTGWVVSHGSNNGLYKTTDGGTTWTDEVLPQKILNDVGAIGNFGETIWVGGVLVKCGGKLRTMTPGHIKPQGLFHASKKSHLFLKLKDGLLGGAERF